MNPRTSMPAAFGTEARRAPHTFLGAFLLQCAADEGSVRALARCLQVSPQTLYDIIAGRPPGKYVRRVLADYLEVPPATVDAWAVEPVAAAAPDAS